MQNTYTTRIDETDELLAVLADHDRRIVLEYFRDSTTRTASVDDLVEAVNERGHSRDGEVRLVLHHSTLPRLADVGVVDYDPDRRTVRYLGHELLETLLEAIQDAGRRRL